MDELDETLRQKIQREVDKLQAANGGADVYHPELGCIVKNGRAMPNLIKWFKKYDKARAKTQL